MIEVYFAIPAGIIAIIIALWKFPPQGQGDYTAIGPAIVIMIVLWIVFYNTYAYTFPDAFEEAMIKKHAADVFRDKVMAAARARQIEDEN